MSEAPGNRLQYPDHVLWQGEKMGKLLLAAAIPLALLPMDMADLAGETGLPKGVMASLAIPLSLFVVGGYWFYKHRRLAIGLHGMTLTGLRRQQHVPWSSLASVKVKLRLGGGEAPSNVLVRAVGHDGRKIKHTLNFIEADLLHVFAWDVYANAGQSRVPVEVVGSKKAVRAYEALLAQQQQSPYGY
jgi:hypothetical protein